MNVSVRVEEFGRARALRLMMLLVILAVGSFWMAGRAEAACAVPNQITNGQPADATAVMDNFNALEDCVDAKVSPTGTPVAGNLSVFSSSNTVTSGNLSGDCTTTGTLSVTCTKTSGTAFGPLATGTDAGQLTGTISTSRFNNGTNADSSTFLRGDGVWAPVSGGGGGGGGTQSEVQWIKPLVANFTWVNQGTTATAVDTPFGIALRDDTAIASGNFRILEQAAPTSTPWTVYIRLSPFVNPTLNAGQSAVIIRNSANGKLIEAGPWHNAPGSFLIQRWNSATAYSANVLNVVVRQSPPYWMSVTNDGTSLIFKLSPDGYTWGVPIHTEALSTFLGGADRIGFGIQMNNSATGMVVNSFSKIPPGI